MISAIDVIVISVITSAITSYVIGKAIATRCLETADGYIEELAKKYEEESVEVIRNACRTKSHS